MDSIGRPLVCESHLGFAFATPIPVIPGAYGARTFIFHGTFDFVFSVDRTSIIADKRTGNLGMQACDESRVVRRLLTAAHLSVGCKNSCTKPKNNRLRRRFRPKVRRVRVQEFVQEMRRLLRPLNIRKKMKISVIYTGKIGQI
jgi:hypothetical protein